MNRQFPQEIFQYKIPSAFMHSPQNTDGIILLIVSNVYEPIFMYKSLFELFGRMVFKFSSNIFSHAHSVFINLRNLEETLKDSQLEFKSGMFIPPFFCFFLLSSLASAPFHMKLYILSSIFFRHLFFKLSSTRAIWEIFT